MNTTKIVFASTVIMAVFLIAASLTNQFGEVVEEPNLELSDSAVLPLTPRKTDGFAVTGTWEGDGYAKIWVETDLIQALAFDTRALESETLFSQAKFSEACMDSCNLPESTSALLKVNMVGDGLLTIEKLHYATPQNPIGMALCPNCKRVAQANEPDHSLLIIVLLLAISIFGSRTLGRYCQSNRARYTLLGIFALSFLIFAGFFSIIIAAPTSAIAITAKRTASIFSAIGVLTLFTILAVEITRKTREPPEWEPDEWERK